MTDVEKYGLFALVFVVSILGLAWLLGPDDALPTTFAGAGSEASSVVLARPTATLPRLAQGSPPRRGREATANPDRPEGQKASRAARYSVAPLVDTKAEFHFDDAPVSYPGERSASLAEPIAGYLQHRIRKSETLSDVSKLYYGTNHEWRVILKANPGLDETKLQVGQEILVPRAATKGQLGGTRDSSGIYVVREGDTLGGIALRELGSTERLSDLYSANRDVMASPDKLKVGMHLRIP